MYGHVCVCVDLQETTKDSANIFAKANGSHSMAKGSAAIKNVGQYKRKRGRRCGRS